MLGYKTANYDLGVIPKMVYLFGTVFKDMAIPRLNTDGTSLKELIKVPIIYSAKDKLIEAVRGDPTKDRRPAVTLPIMSFEHVDTIYDEERKLSAMNKIVIEDIDNGKFKSQYTPVPFNFAFELHCYAENALDLNNIIEQVIPFFTPEYTAKAVLIPTMNKIWDIPIVYNGYGINDGNNGPDTKIEDRRMVFTTLKFVVKGWLFGPIVVHPVIKFANVNFWIPSGNNNIIDIIGNTQFIADRVTVRPGLLPNGQPTSNIAMTVPLANITAQDDFGYITYIAGIIGTTDPSGGE